MKILQNMCKNVFEYRRKALSFHPIVSSTKRYYCSRWDNTKLRVLFFGTDNFSLPSLRVLNESLKSGGTVSSLEVVTSFKAKKNPLKQYAQNENLALHSWPIQRTSIKGTFDLGVVVSFGHLIPEELIAGFRLGMLNVHASLLPKLRGAAPIVHAIKNGDSETGVTIMRIKPNHFDVGEILTQRRVPIGTDTLMPELHTKLAEIGASALLSCIENIDHYLENLIAQHDCDATYAPKVTPHFSNIRWHGQSAKEVYDLYRSLVSYKPLTTHLDGKLVKMFKVSYDPQQQCDVNAKAGRIEYCRKRKRLRVSGSDGKFVEIDHLSIGGKRIMSAQEFNNGYLSKTNSENRFFE
ncbi:methionyl-tRNA formyltransferase, mitochondrial [Toxorhynchites rutilus septentrionalis]|uniref:methionyl-tRNA formyltransferase, mitochondrial n=1 Tax=Toxorhynchites rutilus septentrionalis TaxID=329112 RepID=UPI0024799CFB|nr:methionyl-tRNA formyltransferase, mitochondrial [Toxorhynchites rutilus septentrionalis]